nr:DUF4326 domain-containing protein [Nocardia asiatica]
MPERIQLRRSAGWCKPPNAVVVARPSKWGNPCRWRPGPITDAATGEVTECTVADARRIAVDGFRNMLADPESRAINRYPSDEEILAELRGKDLCCWCPLEDEHGNRIPCHADVLLELANPEVIEVPPRCPECSSYLDSPGASAHPLCSTCRPKHLGRPDARDAAYREGYAEIERQERESRTTRNTKPEGQP